MDVNHNLKPSRRLWFVAYSFDYVFTFSKQGRTRRQMLMKMLWMFTLSTSFKNLNKSMKWIKNSDLRFTIFFLYLITIFWKVLCQLTQLIHYFIYLIVLKPVAFEVTKSHISVLKINCISAWKISLCNKYLSRPVIASSAIASSGSFLSSIPAIIALSTLVL